MAEEIRVNISAKDMLSPEMKKAGETIDDFGRRVDATGNIIKEKASVVLERYTQLQAQATEETKKHTEEQKKQAEATSQAAEATKKANSVTSNSKATWGELTKHIGEFNTASGSVVPGMSAAGSAISAFSAGPIAAGVIAVGAFIGAMVKIGTTSWDVASQFAESINDMTNKTGMTAEAASKFIEIGKIVGMSGGEMGQAMAMLSRNAEKAYESIQKTGIASDTSSDKFTKWGIAITDSNGEMLKAEEIYENIRIKHQQMQDGAQKTAMEMELFGRSGAKLNRVLDTSDETIQQWTDRLEAAGLIMSGETADGFEQVEQRGRLFDEVLNGIWQTIGVGLLPVIDNLINFCLELTDDLNKNSESGSWLKDTVKALANTMNDAINDARAFYNMFKLVGRGILEVGENATWLQSVLQRFGNIQISDAVKAVLGPYREAVF